VLERDVKRHRDGELKFVRLQLNVGAALKAAMGNQYNDVVLNLLTAATIIAGVATVASQIVYFSRGAAAGI
jgi:hypothetical protein